MNGLKALHKQLKQVNYKLCSCVPLDRYESTCFQNWLKADTKAYKTKAEVNTPLTLMDQYVVLEVQYNIVVDWRCVFLTLCVCKGKYGSKL